MSEITEKLLDYLKNFGKWIIEIEGIEKDVNPTNIELMRILYGSSSSNIKNMAGGPNAPIYKHILDLIKRLQESYKELKVETMSLMKDAYIYDFNLGTHFYPGCDDPCGDGFFTSDCKYCTCVMGQSRSSGPDGIDPFGKCPGNLKIKTVYEALKKQVESINK